MDAKSTRRNVKRKQVGCDRITTTIEREWLAEIIAGTKKIEYREIKPYWPGFPVRIKARRLPRTSARNFRVLKTARRGMRQKAEPLRHPVVPASGVARAAACGSLCSE
jgi:hypothetical protein